MKIFCLVLCVATLMCLNLFTNRAYAQVVTPVPSAQSSQTSFSLPSVSPPSNPFNYEPLPLRSQSSDIAEVSPLTASRNIVQVDDYITFSVTIENVAPYAKMIQQLCFESTDGNFGCQWGIPLVPQQTFTINNVGTWITGGTKSVWITWSQDGFNYYEPVNANHVQVHIVQ